MNNNTINSEVTMGGASGTLLGGRYRVVRQLGQGGMGSVWLAEDTKLDGFKVAIKMLPSVLVNNKRAYAQVKSEALVSLKLSHPNIVTVRAFEEEGGSPFLVMDYIDGQTLDDYLAEKGKLTEEETGKLLKPVAAALDYAHTQGVVHRDVKPGNVMIRKDGTPFVLDFGIAREIQETMTRVTGKLSSGTLLYMSPEQLNGEAPKPAQDIYSFAAMAYECLKGEPPFSRGQVEFQILNKEPEPLPGGSPLAKTILRGLLKDPAARPVDCRGVMTALGRPAVPQHRSPLKVEVPPEEVRFIPPQDRVRFGTSRARPSFGPSRSGKGPVKSPAKVSVNEPEQHSVFRKMLNNKWLAVGVIVLSIVLIGLNVDFKKSKRPAPLPSSPNALQRGDDEVDMCELDKVRIEAQVKVASCRRLDKGDGFAAKVEECENGLVRAKSEYELKHFGDSLRSYKDVLERGAGLVALDADRQRARTAAAKLERQARAAKEAKADSYVTERFNAAKELIIRAKNAFAEMRFAEAADNHELAAQQFELAVGEAKTEAERRKGWRQEGKPFTISDDGLGLTMIWCPAGSFDMGSPEDEIGRVDNEKLHRVTLTCGFWMGETEVTQGQWKQLMDGETVVDLARKGLEDETPVNVAGKWMVQRDSWELAKDGDPTCRTGDLDDDLPVYNVAWTEACRFCSRLTERERANGRVPDGYEYRLPTEAEWEYACRAGEQAALPNGLSLLPQETNDVPSLDDIAWYIGNCSHEFVGRGSLLTQVQGRQYPGERGFSRKVRLKRPNAWGLYDMIGNMREWCGDLIDFSVTDATDPLGAASGRYRVARGGAWDCAAAYCRSARRDWVDPGLRSYSMGLRVALAPRHEGYPRVETPMTATQRMAVESAARNYAATLAARMNDLPNRVRKVRALFDASRFREGFDAITADMMENPEVQYLLGWYYDADNRYEHVKDGAYSYRNPNADDAKAVAWYQKAADAGHATALSRLGFHYIWGRGVVKDLRRGGELYRQAAAKGDGFGLLSLGDCYMSGNIPGIPANRAMAVRQYEKASNCGIGRASYALAQLYGGLQKQGGEAFPADYGKAEKYARLGIRQGNVMAKLLLAKLIIGGKIRETDLTVESLLEEYAERQTVNNMVIALMFRNGYDVPVDKARALQWYRKAADLGWPHAYYQIGTMYKNGEGVGRNPAAAESWFRQAAAKGVKEAQNELAQTLYDRPANMNFCRHCRTPLTSYSKVPRNCPNCGKNLFGN